MNPTRRLATASTLFLCLLLFLVPSNWFFKFNETNSYVNGLLVDYLLPKLYATDLILVVMLGLSLVANFAQLMQTKITFTPKIMLLAALSLLFIIRQFFTPFPVAAGSYLLHLVLAGGLALSLWKRPAQLVSYPVLIAVVLTLLFQSMVGLYQFQTQESVGGYSFLGEVELSQPLNLAKASFAGEEKILAYGTTAHPNVLAGFLVAYSWLSVLLAQRLKVSSSWKIGVAGVILLAAITLWQTQSWSAIVSAFFSGLYGLTMLLPKKISRQLQLVLITTSIVLFLGSPFLVQLASNITSSPSISRRQSLTHTGVTLWLTQPLAGVGLNQTTALLETVSVNQEVVRFIQPVHHLGVLWLTETGALGVGLLASLWYLARKKSSQFSPALCLLLPLASFDHYLLTINTGLLILVIVLVSSELIELKE